MSTQTRSEELAKELAETMRQIRLAFPASGDFRNQHFYNSIEYAEAELEKFRMGLWRDNIAVPIATALKTAKRAFQSELSYQRYIDHAERLLGYLQIELSREALAPTSPATPAS